MHGEALDWIILNTVKDGSKHHTGRFHGGEEIYRYIPYEFKDLDYQPIYPRVFEVGSYNVNGSMKEYNFLGRESRWIDICGVQEYLGLDLIAGPCVDIIGNSHDIPQDDDQFDLVFCLNMLEHDNNPIQTLKECFRILKLEGTFILSVPDLHGAEHGTNEHMPDLAGGGSNHYNFFTGEMIIDLVKESGLIIKHFQIDNGYIFCNATKERNLNVIS